MCKVVLVLLLVLVSACCCAQDQDTDPTENLVPDMAIKFSPIHLINFYPTVQLAFEKKIRKKLTAQIDLGYILQNNKLRGNDFGNMRGYKTKAEARQYIAGG